MENYKGKSLGWAFLLLIILFFFICSQISFAAAEDFGGDKRKRHPASYEKADKYSFARQRDMP